MWYTHTHTAVLIHPHTEHITTHTHTHSATTHAHNSAYTPSHRAQHNTHTHTHRVQQHTHTTVLTHPHTEHYTIHTHTHTECNNTHTCTCMQARLLHFKCIIPGCDEFVGRPVHCWITATLFTCIRICKFKQWSALRWPDMTNTQHCNFLGHYKSHQWQTLYDNEETLIPIELYASMPLYVILAIFQGHRSIELLKFRVNFLVSSFLIEFRLCVIVKKHAPDCACETILQGGQSA